MLSSTAQGVRFKVIVSADLTGLDQIRSGGSVIACVKTVQVAIPSGASARIVSATKRLPMPIAVDALNGEGLSLRNLPLASLSHPLEIRGREFVAVQISPILSGEVYQEVEVTLALDGGLKLADGIITPDPLFERMLRNSVINAENMIAWPQLVPSVGSDKIAKPEQGPFSRSDTWYKIAIDQSGLCRITGAELEGAGLSLADLQSDSIRVFSGGGLPLEMLNSRPRPELNEIAIRVEDGGDGLFGKSDQILFYGEAVNRWIYRADSAPRFVSNPYTPNNIYWLTVSGDYPAPRIRMQDVDGSLGGAIDTTISSCWSQVHVEQDHLLMQDGDSHVDNFYTWYWSDSTRVSFFFGAPGAISSDSARITVVGRTGYPFIELDVNQVRAVRDSADSYRCSMTSRSLINGLNQVTVSLSPISRAVSPYLDNLECSYHRQLVPENDRLDIALGEARGRGRIQIADDFVSRPIILEVSNPLHPKEVTGAVSSNGVLSFDADLLAENANRFYCASRSAAVKPVSITQAHPSDLRAASSQTDLIIITPKSFTSALGEYTAYRSAQGYAIRIVAIEDVMDNFSFGLFDPTAIRDFLKYAYENRIAYPAPIPSAVLFVGDANYDFLNHLETSVPNLVPTYINPMEVSSIGNTYGDDNYVYFGKYGILDSDTSRTKLRDRGYDMMTARWPVKSVSEIAMITKKIKTYESAANLGAWRNAVTLVADDEFGAESDETYHTTQTETLEQAHLPRNFNRTKIYLWDYPFVNRQKPAVNDAIVEAFNAGSLLVNYVGHGNPDVWSHEHVFTRTSDLSRLNNNNLPLVIAASCAIGFFDDPRRESMGEDLLSMAHGAIGVISAMRLVFSYDNAQLNRQIYDYMMSDKSLTIGESLFLAKMTRQYGGGSIPQQIQNDRGYAYFGDPYLRLGQPVLNVSFDPFRDSLTALKKMSITGSVTDHSGAPVGFDGTLKVTVFDSERHRVHRLLNSGGAVVQSVPYNLPGPTIFRGSAPINDGRFSFDFIAPLDIGYGGQGARISAYAVLDTVDAAGVADSIPVSSAVAPTTDSSGPAISFSVGDRANMVGGETVGLNEVLQLTISDSSGVNLAGGLAHGITLEVDERADKMINVTDLFAYEVGTYAVGHLQYSLSELEPGEHQFKIKAWDNANNSSSVQFSLKLTAQQHLAIIDLLNYPNPMSAQTTFYFELTDQATRFSLEIFTLSGKKIKTYVRQGLAADNYPNNDYSIVWDGHDAVGDRVASGVYIYKATAQPLQGGRSVESFGKVVVIN